MSEFKTAEPAPQPYTLGWWLRQLASAQRETTINLRNRNLSQATRYQHLVENIIRRIVRKYGKVDSWVYFNPTVAFEIPFQAPAPIPPKFPYRTFITDRTSATWKCWKCGAIDPVRCDMIQCPARNRVA